MSDARIAIVGGGLSGLYAAYLLEQQGIADYVLLEARNGLGGRILSVRPEGSDSRVDRFDLGATWFWPSQQPELAELVEQLGLTSFEQQQSGDSLFERSQASPIQRFSGSVAMSGSMRLMRGMAALIDALAGRISPRSVRTGASVKRIQFDHERLILDIAGAAGSDTVRAEQVLLAIPPRLASAIRFEPHLPSQLHTQWAATPTWMAPHAKYIAVFNEPFWRKQGLSGTAQSAVGPLAEIHDASMPGGSAALFGFMGNPARVRGSDSTDALLADCRAQLARLFGPEASSPRTDFIKDWAADPLTATPLDQADYGHHGQVPAATTPGGPWRGRLIGIASEWSPRYPGYMAGAIEAADLAVRRLIVG